MTISESSPSTEIEAVRGKLRQRWELASVLNFLNVFKPIIGKDLKISAEDIETALIDQNSTLAQLHIALLKGILSKSQTLNTSDGWIISLSKTLSMWWPWVAEGDFPLTGAKGKEMSFYKDLDPITRLVILKALCEVRAEQYDAVAYINDSLKDGTDVLYFRKNKLTSDGGGVTFWYEGNETTGHRLYKEVLLFEFGRGKGKATIPEVNCQWETLATNLEEFKEIVNAFSSSEVKVEAALSKSVEIDVIPVLEKQWKKKQMMLQKKQREQVLLNGFRNSVRTRACRNGKPIDYTFDNYDKAIKEAIQYTNKRTTSEERGEAEKPSQFGKRKGHISDESNHSGTESDAERSSHQESDYSEDDNSDEERESEKEDDGAKDSERDQHNVRSQKQKKPLVHRPKGMRFSKRLAGIPGHITPESVNLVAKNRLRQRPSVNTAFDSIVIPDSEDEGGSVDSVN
ncbi:hypothetical protein ACS0TY_012358 [Phlomoides rotata]